MVGYQRSGTIRQVATRKSRQLLQRKLFSGSISRYKEVESELALTVLNLRGQWIKEAEIKTVPEFGILDITMNSYFHYLRLNKAINNIMASIEWEYFALDAPLIARNRGPNENEDRLLAEEHAHRLCEILEPIMDKYHRAYLRGIKALRDLKRGNIMLHIGQVKFEMGKNSKFARVPAQD